MNSRSSVNESDLVNFSADLSTLNQLDSKDGLLSFPFDHLYACHSESTDRRQTLQLDKEVEISTHCVVADDKDLIASTSAENARLTEKIQALEAQNKRLKDLLIYHLDLIQQQNDLICKREKLYHALKLENDSLKAKLARFEKKLPPNQRSIVNPASTVHVPSSVTSTIVKNEPGTVSQITLNSYTELLLPDSCPNQFILENKPFGQDSFDLSTPSHSDVTSYLGVSTILDNSLSSTISKDFSKDYKMIENKRSIVKKENMKSDNTNRSEALYTVTSNSGNPVIQRIQRNKRKAATSLGSLSRISKTPVPKVEVPTPTKIYGEDSTVYDRFSVNKKSKMINTYGKARLASTFNSKRTSQFTGSLSDRLQLIDTTPTGEDPYQLGEADMREQSPIPKLMLQKTNHGRMKICTETSGSTSSAKRIFNSMSDTSLKYTNSIKITPNDRYNLENPYMHPSEKEDSDLHMDSKTLIIEEPDLDLVKTETDIDWSVYNTTKPCNETSLCDFSYGETPNNLASNILPSLDALDFQDLFEPDPMINLDTLTTMDYNVTAALPNPMDKSKKHTSALLGPNYGAAVGTGVAFGPGAITPENKNANDAKGGRKRALSTTGLLKTIKRENCPKGAGSKPKASRAKAPCRGKKSPLPAMVTKKPYHTLLGDPDLIWHRGLDPDVKSEEAEEWKASTVEVPRWREKPYTSCYTLEGTENLDDKIFEKRHQKLEAEERRQLRWHMRRIREQRQVERLRQRQRDSWCSGGTSPAQVFPPTVHTVWPEPQRDVRFIEVTDVLPVTAFGEILPALPEKDFVLPWVRTTKAMKRSKRSKTLH